MDEEFEFKVGQVLEELERMQPDIDAEVQAEFGAQADALSKREAGTWGNVKASKEDDNAPNIQSEAEQQIANNFEQARADLENNRTAFRSERVNFRASFMIDKLFEGSTEEEKSAAFDAVQQRLAPPAVTNEAENDAGQGDHFNPDDFANGEEGGAWERGDLTGEFNDGNDPPPPPGRDGIEP